MASDWKRAARRVAKREETLRADAPKLLNLPLPGAVRHQTPEGRKFTLGLRAPALRPGAAGDLRVIHAARPVRTRTAVQSEGWRERSVPCHWDKDHSRRTDRRHVPALVSPPEPKPLKPSVTVVRRRAVVVTVPRVKEEVLP